MLSHENAKFVVFLFIYLKTQNKKKNSNVYIQNNNYTRMVEKVLSLVQI